MDISPPRAAACPLQPVSRDWDDGALMTVTVLSDDSPLSLSLRDNLLMFCNKRHSAVAGQWEVACNVGIMTLRLRSQTGVLTTQLEDLSPTMRRCREDSD